MLNNKSIYTIIVLFILFFNQNAISQNINLSLLSNGGNSFKNDKYILGWSIGENLIETFESESYILTQGLQQTEYNISSVYSNESKYIGISCFPNPTSDEVSILISENNLNLNNLSIKLFNLDGTLLENININNNMKINLSKYLDGIYFININKNDELIKSFRIIKTYK